MKRNQLNSDIKRERNENIRAICIGIGLLAVLLVDGYMNMAEAAEDNCQFANTQNYVPTLAKSIQDDLDNDKAFKRLCGAVNHIESFTETIGDVQTFVTELLDVRIEWRGNNPFESNDDRYLASYLEQYND